MCKLLFHEDVTIWPRVTEATNASENNEHIIWATIQTHVLTAMGVHVHMYSQQWEFISALQGHTQLSYDMGLKQHQGKFVST